MYEVITSFTDLKDNNYKYQVGDKFPHDGIEVSKERIEELLTDKNRRHKPMITEVVEKKAEEAKTEEKSAPKKGGRKKADVK